MEGQNLSVSVGDEVAAMPLNATSPADVLDILKVSFVRAATVQLTNGKQYSIADGKGLVTNDRIEPATESHRSELKRRTAAEKS